MSKYLLALFLFLIVCVSLFSFGTRDRDMPIVQVTGVVRLVGTSLFPEIVISNSENTWYIANEDMNKLHALQHRTVTIEGEETVTEMYFASGMPAGTRRKLQNIKVLTIH